MNDFICISRTAAAACCCCCARIYLIYLTWRGREPRFQIPGQHFVKKKRFLWRADSIQLQRKPFTCNSSGASWRTILPLKQVFLFCWWLNPHAVRVLKRKRELVASHIQQKTCAPLWSRFSGSPSSIRSFTFHQQTKNVDFCLVCSPLFFLLE